MQAHVQGQAGARRGSLLLTSCFFTIVQISVVSYKLQLLFVYFFFFVLFFDFRLSIVSYSFIY